MPRRYPPTRTVDQVDDYHGTKVKDPYRWLEDLDSPETAAWVKEQNRFTAGVLRSIPGRERIAGRLRELWRFDRFPSGRGDHLVRTRKRGGRYFMLRGDGQSNQSVLEVMDAPHGAPRVLYDPNALASDGTVAITAFAPSGDGAWVACGLSTAGTDWREWRVADAVTGETLADHLRWGKFSGASWVPDGSGFYYSGYDEPRRLEDPTYFHKLYFHRLGRPQADDVLVYERPDRKEWGFEGEVTEDGRFLVITVTVGTDVRNGIFYRDLSRPGSPVVELLRELDAAYDLAGSQGPVLYFRTDRDAPRGRLVAIDVRSPDKWTEVVGQSSDTLESVRLAAGRLVCLYLVDGHSELRVFELDGSLAGAPDLPGVGTVANLDGRAADTEILYSYTSYTTPGSIRRHDFATGRSDVLRAPKPPFYPDAFETSQVFYESKDGTRVPMFLSSRKGLEPSPDCPTYLTGYGGFNIPSTPMFSVTGLVWMELGGLLAVACLRGGGEYGEEWHREGMKHNKQNVFDDFAAAAEWLIRTGRTSTPRLAIGGGSNGGLLVGACITQRPELFGAAHIAVGVLDMLRFDKFTIGWAWVSDYGSPDDPGDFRTLYAYSPLHNLKPGTRYPATLVVTGDHDDRVVPSHSFKFTAALQAAQGGEAPVLARIETRAGHGMGKPIDKQIDEAADVWAFLLHVLGL